MQTLTDFYQKITTDINLYRIVNDLISIPTDGDADNHQKCLEYITKYIKKINSQIIIHTIPTAGKNNLLIGINVQELDNIQTGLMLCGHLDVVTGKSEQFSPITDGNRIYGRGTTDMKGSIACYLDLLPYFNTLKCPIILCLTCDEETKIQGIRDVCFYLQKHNIRPQLTILGEPTENKLGIRSTGIESYKTTIHGISAHSSVPDKGVSALFVAAGVLQKLEIIMQKMLAKELYLNVGTIVGGGSNTMIPDKAEIDWSIRYVSEKDATDVMQMYNTAVADIVKQYPNARIETAKTEEFLKYRATDENQVEDLCRKLQIKSVELPYTSEAGYLAQNGQNVYLLGCGNIEQAHSDNEYLGISELIAYRQLLQQLAKICNCEQLS